MSQTASVNAISGRLSLRTPQREALEILDRVMEIAPPARDGDVDAALAEIRREFPQVTGFERDFPSLCFALATGVGKTRLMGAFITYLHTAHGIDNFFVLAPNITVYRKLIADFTPNTPKYVFTGVSAFATTPPDIITGETWESYTGRLFDAQITCRINIFNIAKITTESRQIKSFSEYIGQSYFDWLKGLPNLVLLMDESHRYRARAGVSTINELDPVLGLELTATPYVTSGKRTVPFENVVQDYALRRAMEDGFVKEPAVVTRQNLDVRGMSVVELERMKLEDGIRLHEQTRVELETYARNTGQPRVKPFVLVIARDTTHAGELLALIRSGAFFDGRYAGKVIQVDSSGTGVEKDETVERLLRVEKADEPTEIVIHVNMLKEGWDVNNLYTIVPLRAANARVLIEQTIGRGLRLPYGRRTGVAEVDRLSIVAHDRFQEIVDEANRDDSIVQMRQIVLTDDDLREQPRSVVIQPTVEARLGIAPTGVSDVTAVPDGAEPPLFTDPAETDAVRRAYDAITKLQRHPDIVPDIAWLQRPEVRERIVREVAASYDAGQLGLAGVAPVVDLARVVEETARVVVEGTISIPRISIEPVGEVTSRFEPFEPDLRLLNFPPVDDALTIQNLRDGRQTRMAFATGAAREHRLENYVVSALVDYDEVSYDDHAELLQDIATRVVAHFRAYLADDAQVEGVLLQHQKLIGRHLHGQMMQHHREDAAAYEPHISAGFTIIRSGGATATGEVRDFRRAPARLSEIGSQVYGGFHRCLQTVLTFDSNTERLLAVVLDRDSLKWFRPGAGQFRIAWRAGANGGDYRPDFVAELDERIVMLEPKRGSEMDDPIVLAKRDAAVTWCQTATDHARGTGGKPWTYALIPHDAIAEHWTLDHLLSRYAAT